MLYRSILMIAFLLSALFSLAQDDNFLQFKILSRIGNEPIMSASLRVEDSIAHRLYQNFSDSNGLVRFNLSWLISDSAYVSLGVAMDTILVFKIYKQLKYGYEMKLYIDTEAIKWKNELMRNGKRKKRS